MMTLYPPSRRAAWLVAVAALGFGSSAAFAQGQSAVITGRVRTAAGTPVQGTNVFISEMNVSVGTNAAGQYIITIPSQRVSGQAATLRVRSIGYKPLSRPIRITAGSQTADFTLNEDVNRLDEVVVTGVAAGTAARNVPFAVSHIDSSQMPVIGANAVQQLQGKVAGANITSNSGRPGAAPSVVLRGPTSINAQGRDQGPLYIVDGILLQSGTPDINPNDIENVEVVKGAAAASLYGARAGGGVINITTKTGRTSSEGVHVGVRSEVGRNDIPHQFALATQTALPFDPSGQYFCAASAQGGSPCARYIDMNAERRRVNDVSSTAALAPQSFLHDFGIANNPLRYRALNMFQANTFPETYNQVEQATKTDTWQNTNVDLRGKTGSTGYYASAGYAKQAGAFAFLKGYERGSARLNLDQLIGSKLSFTGTTYYSSAREDGVNQQGGDNGTAFFRLSRSPAFVNQQTRDSQGRLYIRSNPLSQGSQNENPYYNLEQNVDRNSSTRFLGSVQGRYAALDWLDFNADFAYDRSGGNYTLLNDRGFRTTTVNPAAAVGSISARSGDDRSYNTSAGAAARPTLMKNLTSTFTAQVLYDAQKTNFAYGYGENLAVPGLFTLNSASVNKDIQSGTSEVNSLSYRAGGTFELLDRYILDLNIRREGSSLFGSNNRWATFPRVAGAWIASSEPWFPAADAFSLLKFRAAWGKAGVRPSTVAQYETFSISRTTGAISPNTLGNVNLLPEVLTETELGTDIELFHKYGINLTYAHSLANNQILLVPAPAASGFPNQYQNAGVLENKTYEASLDIPLISRQNMKWSTRFIYDRNRAIITELNAPPYNTTGGVQGSESMYFVRPGERLGTIYGGAYVTNCSQLPGNFASQCGGPGSQFQTNSQGFIVWTGGYLPTQGITNNLWNASLNPKDAPWGGTQNRTVWGMPIRLRDSLNAPVQVALGNSSPDFHAGWSSNFSLGKFTAYGLLDGAFGRKVWNEGYHWALGDLMAGTVDQGGKSVEDAKPIGYYYRAGPADIGASSGVGGLYNVLGPTNESVEDASYVKLREASVTYNFGAVGGQGNWTLGLVGRNLHTWTKYRGYDPEVGRSGSGTTGSQLNNGALNGVDYFSFPNLRTFTFQVSTTF
ncbi:MAG: putative outer membrane protein [Gemmatimonadetes bacterium]|nr:putative outer membrane protein [Gemmatimonadota bacterium]